MTHKIVRTTLVSALIAAGTLTLAYPTGTNPGTFANGKWHRLATKNGNVFKAPNHFTLSYGSSNITLTWGSASPTIPVGTEIFVQLDIAGSSPQRTREAAVPSAAMTAGMAMKWVDFGAPITADDDGICAAQAIAAAGNALINGALAVSGVVPIDVARNLQIVSSGAGDTTQTVTVYSKDEYNRTVVETIALNGTSAVQSVKAHKKVTRVAVSAALAGNLKVGTASKLGMPIFLPNTGHVIKEIYDGGPVTNGTLTAGSMSAQTATSGDVRGLYSPNTAPNGTHTYSLMIATVDPDFFGVDQYAG